MNPPLLGAVRTEVKADAYLSSSAASAPAMNTPGAIAGGYVLYFEVVGAGNGGRQMNYASGAKWGRTSNVTVAGRPVPICDSGLDTLHLSTHMKLASCTAAFTQNAYGRIWSNPLAEFPGDFVANSGGFMGPFPLAQFLCLTR